MLKNVHIGYLKQKITMLDHRKSLNCMIILEFYDQNHSHSSVTA